MKRCPDCGRKLPLAEYSKRANGQPFAYCRPCHNRRCEASRVGASEPVTASDELARLRTRITPSVREWGAVQQAAEAIRAYLEAKAKGEERYEGVRAWAILESVTTDERRFHQLASLATVQQRVWEDERVGKVRFRGKRVPAELVIRVRALHTSKFGRTAIAAKTGLSQSAVSKILLGLTYRDRSPTDAGVPTQQDAA